MNTKQSFATDSKTKGTNRETSVRTISTSLPRSILPVDGWDSPEISRHARHFHFRILLVWDFGEGPRLLRAKGNDVFVQWSTTLLFACSHRRFLLRAWFRTFPRRKRRVDRRCHPCSSVRSSAERFDAFVDVSKANLSEGLRLDGGAYGEKESRHLC